MKRRFTTENIFIIFVLTLCLIFLAAPLVQSGLIEGDDSIFHLARLNSLYDTLKAGIFPVKIHTTIFNDFGYGYSFFYANFFLYIPALLMLAGLDITNSYKIFLVIIFIIQIISTYYASYTLLKHKLTALVPTILIILSHNYILNVYYRFALGEYLAFAFFPLIIAGLYNLVHDDYGKPYLLGIGFCGVVLSHIISTYLAIVFSIIYFLVHFKSIVKSKNFKRLIFTALAVLGVTAFFWIPLLEQLTYQTLRLSIPMTYSSDNAITLFNLFNNSTYTLGSGIVIPVIMICGLAFFFSRNRLFQEYLVYGVIAALLGTTPFAWLWKLSEGVFNIQFAWRIFGLATILLAFACGIFINGIMDKPKDTKKLVLIIMSVFALNLFFAQNQIGYIMDNRSEIATHQDYNNPNALGYTQEYLPLNISDSKHFQEADYVASADGNVIFADKDNLTCTFYTDGSDYYDVPLVSYKGYAAYDDNGEKLKVTVSDTGLVRVYANSDTTTITVTYEGTTLQSLSYWLSLISLLIVVIATLKSKKVRHK